MILAVDWPEVPFYDIFINMIVIAVQRTFFDEPLTCFEALIAKGSTERRPIGPIEGFNFLRL